MIRRFKKFTNKKTRLIYSGRCKKKVIEWYFGNICNINCSYCLNAYTRRDYYRNMTFEETNKTIDFINSIDGIYQIVFIGGEPSRFKHCLYAIEKINQSCRINIMTNGLDEKFIEDAVKLATFEKNLLICCSMHYEYYLQDKVKYMQHLYRLVEICKDNPHVELEFLILLDDKRTIEYKELVQWIIRNAIGFKENFGYSISYVRRDNMVNEAIKNYAITSIFDKDVRDKLRQNLKTERMSFINENPNYHKPCNCFRYYMHICLDGRLKHADCNSPIYSKKSIFDDDFNLEDEYRCIECCEKHTENNGICNVVLGKYKR